ncbi:MAG: HAD family phosphatase [Cyclobacteriaceae bacterium]|nr:HAD family phosphatase [Cyclobacteriaceae bacterium]
MPVSKEINNVIFDLGGVILNLDIDNTYGQFSRLSGKSIEQLKTSAVDFQFFNQYECGAMDDATFRSSLRSYLGVNATDEQIDNAWNAMLLDLPSARLDLLKEVGAKFRIFLLSNTNNIHLRAFNNIVRATIGDQPFGSYFEKDYYSHLMGMRKPDREIFQYVLQQNDLKAEETLFLDDSILNLQGAAAIRIQTFHIQHPDQLFSIFNEA